MDRRARAKIKAAAAMATVVAVLMASVAQAASSSAPPLSAATSTTEPVANAYMGSADYSSVLNNMQFTDVGNAWSRDAIIEGVALGIVKGFGAREFGRSAVMTKAQAIAMALRAAGLEGRAQQAGEAIEAAARASGGASAGGAGGSGGAGGAATAPVTPQAADTVWVNGSFSLAKDLGLITSEQYDAAMGDAAAQARTGFSRGGEATRQEFAYWVGRALAIQPTRGQQALFNNFADWREADALFIPYIETFLAERMLTGNPDGTFQPRAGITREQAAQVVKNAKRHVFAANRFEERAGTIERIDRPGVGEGSLAGYSRTIFYIRVERGELDTIAVDKPLPGAAQAAGAARRTGAAAGETGLVVDLQGVMVDDSALAEGDQIRYVTAPSAPSPGGQAAGGQGAGGQAAGGQGAGGQATGGQAANDRASAAQGGGGATARAVKYVRVIAPAARTSYALAQVDEIDAAARSISYTQIFDVARGSVGEVTRLDADATPGRVPSYSRATRAISADVVVKIDGRYVGVDGIKVGVDGVKVGMDVVVGVDARGVVVSIESSGIGFRQGVGGVVKGLVEENNPVLGYVSLYGEHGEPGGMRQALRIYSYVSPASLDVRKDGAPSRIDDVRAGDSAYLMLDADGNIQAISAVTNYKELHGTVVSVSGAALVIRYEDGSQGNLELGEGVLYFTDYRVVGKDALKPGAVVRVLVSDAGGRSIVREVTIARSGDGRWQVAGIYKAVLDRIDETSRKAIVFNVRKFVNGQWVKVDQAGFGSFPVADSLEIVAGGSLVGVDRFNKMLRDSDVYIAARFGYGKVQEAARILVVGSDDAETLFEGRVRSARWSAGLISLVGGPTDMAFGAGTIVVKNGMLVDGQSVAPDDLVRVAIARDDMSGRLQAAVVEVVDPASAAPSVFRGRVSKVDRDRSITLESFSELVGTQWAYANTPKTLAVTYETVLLLAGGVESSRGLDGPLGRGLVGQSVYVVARGSDALAVSAAPFGMRQLRGEVRSLDGVEYGEDGEEAVGGPSGVTLRDVSEYDRARQAWGAPRAEGSQISFAPDSIVIKGGEVVRPSALEKGDRVLVVKVEPPPQSAGGAGGTGGAGGAGGTGGTGGAEPEPGLIFIVEG